MAKALECPNCHAKHRVAGISRVSTFRCTKCGQQLAVPDTQGDSAAESSSAPDPSRSVSSGSGGGAPAPPRRKSRSSSPEIIEGALPPGSIPHAPEPAAADAPGPSTAALSPPPASRRKQPPTTSSGPPTARPTPTPGRAPTRKPPRSSLPLRLAAWALAVPVGLALVGLPARQLGYLTGQKLLDVIVKHNIDRFVPLLVIVALWALATALLVEVFIEGGRWLMMRRRQRGGDDPAGALPGSNGGGSGGAVVGAPGIAPPSRRGRRSVTARRGS